MRGKSRILYLGAILTVAGIVLLLILNRPPFEIEAHSAVLMDISTGRLLFGQSEHEHCSPGSMTKLMVIYLMYDRVAQGKLHWTDSVKVSGRAAAVDGSKVGLKENEVLDAESLLYCIALPSGCDAALAMGEYLAGSEASFVEQMNKTAAELGMKDTHYANIPGFDDPQHFSSSYDTALLARHLVENFPDVLRVSSQMETRIIRQVNGEKISTVLRNTNTLLPLYQGCNGLKTGSTTGAGYCLCATAQRKDAKLISVVMGAASIETRQNEAIKLLDYGFDRLHAN